MAVVPYFLNFSYGTLAELVLACLLIVAAAIFRDFGRAIFLRFLLIARWFERRPVLLIITVGLTPVLVRILLLAINPAPQPQVMEEFNHLFLADTYNLGRITNPSHPLAVMIQTYQQIEWPNYISARPPLPPIFYYIGVALFGSPFAGSLLSIGLTASALCWALLGWIAGRWAALASFLAIVTFCLFGYWINSYWAPTTIVLGGALLFGVVPRIEQRPRLVWAAVCVFALMLLAGTRPYENGIFAAVIFGWLAIRFLKPERRPMIVKAVVLVGLPIAIGVVGIAMAQLWYNSTTTGNFTVMPYQIWRASQDMTPMFLWQPIEPAKEFYNVGAARFAAWNLLVVELVKEGGYSGALQLFSRHAVTFRDLLGPFLFLAFACWSPRWIPAVKTGAHLRQYLMVASIAFMLLALCGPWAGTGIKLIVLFVLFKRWSNRDERLAVLLLFIGMIATSLPTFYMNVYFTAYTAPLLLLVATGMHNLSRWSCPYGASVAGFILLGATLVPIGQAAVSAVNLAGAGIPQRGPNLSHFDHIYPHPRDEVLAQLEGLPGNHVVFVELIEGASSPVDPTWNAPDIDDQKIIWLRHLRPDWTATGQEYYAGRTFWLMQVEREGEFTLIPFPAEKKGVPAPLDSLPNPDRKAAEALGAKQD